MIQEGGETSQDCAEDNGKRKISPISYADSEGVRFQMEHAILE
jgi:hypothetical protein